MVALELGEECGQVVPFDFERGGAGKVLVEKNNAVDALVVKQAGIAFGDIGFQFVGEGPIVFEVNGEDELFADHASRAFL